MAKVEELRKDLDEFKLLASQAHRTRVHDVLTASVRKLEAEIVAALQAETLAAAAGDAEGAKVKPTAKTVCYDVKVTNYAWDQSDKFMKLYVTLKGVQQIPKENIKCDFAAKCVELVVSGLEGKNHTLLITKLFNSILPDASYYKVKTDMVVVFMKKETQQHWSQVLAPDKKTTKEKPETKEDGGAADPSSGLMEMMKQMYNDGDDEMKRTIAKAWTESRDKQGPGGGFDL